MVSMQALEMREGRAIPKHLMPIHETVRQKVPYLAKDSVIAPMIASCEQMLKEGAIINEQEACDFVTESNSNGL